MIEGWDDSKCCCHSPDARECLRSRYNIDPDDYDYDDDCECCCHAEYDEYWLDREDADL